MAKSSYVLGDKIKQHFKDNAYLYCLVIVFATVGIVIGIYLSVTGYRYTSLLSASDKNIFDYINGTASYTSIFYARLIDVFVCLLIILVFNLSIYTSFLSYIFLSYQMALIVLSSSAIISLYGFTGIINVVLFVLPINLANFVIMSIAICISIERARAQKTYKLKFAESFKATDFFKGYFICALLMLIVCVVHSFILPLFIKSFVVINY